MSAAVVVVVSAAANASAAACRASGDCPPIDGPYVVIFLVLSLVALAVALWALFTTWRR